MRVVQILEDNDTVLPTDLCRPLTLTYASAQSDYAPTRAGYSGRIINNLHWMTVSKTFGECWHGKTVKQICNPVIGPYEFMREGD